MTPLATILARRIAATGPITIADYMTECLLHPEHGYYTTQTPFGADGDFTTAPEISQMFGELVGITIAQAWMDQGRPTPFTLAELGPGRGTLMADILRATKSVPGFADAVQIFMVEASAHLKDQQRKLLGDGPVWVSNAFELPDAPLFLVANEFFDALPIRQFSRHENGWQEHLVGWHDDGIAIGKGTPTPFAALDHRLDDTKPGDVVEICPAAGPVMTEIEDRVSNYGGVALIFDYGDWRSQGDTFQAVSAHAYTDPIATPGQVDLTAHVDFESLAQSAEKLTHSRLTPLGVFLERLGITQRAQALAAKLDGENLNAHIAAHRRLTHPEEMGTLFKVLGFVPDGAPPLAGFEQ